LSSRSGIEAKRAGFGTSDHEVIFLQGEVQAMSGSGTNAKHPGRMTLHYLTGAGLAMLSVGAAPAQPYPDLSGNWELRNDSFNVPHASVTPGMLAGAAAQIRHDIEALTSGPSSASGG